MFRVTQLSCLDVATEHLVVYGNTMPPSCDAAILGFDRTTVKQHSCFSRAPLMTNIPLRRHTWNVIVLVVSSMAELRSYKLVSCPAASKHITPQVRLRRTAVWTTTSSGNPACCIVAKQWERQHGCSIRKSSILQKH